MEGKKYILIAIFVLSSCVFFGQNNLSIYYAYTKGKMDKWKFTMDSIDLVKQKKDKEILDLVNYQYGYIAWCINNKQTDEAEKYLKKAKINLSYLEQKNYGLSMVYAYKAAFVGFEIGLEPYKAPFIGSQSLEYSKKSVSLDSGNPLAFMQLGNIAFYKPSIFGGSKTEALQHYLKALQLMDNNSNLWSYNWNYLNLLATLINAYIEQKQYELAQKYCIKALAIEPEFDWVKNILYPQVLKKLKQ